ncbi:MAG TPA: Tat pathway signal protein [Brevundimonas sp.]|jgi:hypothetical protein
MNRRALFSLAPLAGVALAAAALPALASEGGEGGGAPKETFMPLGTVTATIIRPDGRRGVMTVETGIDIADPELNKQALLQTPRLIAAHNDVVQRTASGMRPDQVPDLDRLAHDLQVATFLVLRKRGAVVLLGTVMIN